MIQKRIGARIRDARERRDLSQSGLSQLLAARGVALHQTGIARLENGGRPLNVVELLTLADVLGVEAGSLLQDERQARTMQEFRWGVSTIVQRIQDRILDVVHAAERHNELVERGRRMFAEHVEDEVRLGLLADDVEARARRRAELGEGALRAVQLAWDTADETEAPNGEHREAPER